MKKISTKKLTTKNFSKYGQVIELDKPPKNPNQMKRLGSVSIPDFQGGQAVIDVLYSYKRPLKLPQIEKHSNSTQTFIPLTEGRFLIVVGTGPKKLMAFVSNGNQGLTLRAGIWHCSPIPIDRSITFTILHRSPDVDLAFEFVDLPDNYILLQLSP
jgi:ureidoglycolate lyase